MTKLYNASENGYPGDEDQGQTSSWYVLSALGFYSVCPGTNQYVLGSPLFRKATIRLENGKQFIITANGNSAENVYTHKALLNGKPYSRTFITYQDMAAGGTLSFEMRNTADKQKKLQPEDLPYSVSK